MKITHLRKVLQLRESHWIAPFVYLNSRQRKAAVNKLKENFYKIIVSSAFGRTMESKLGRNELEIIRNERELLQKAALSSMKSFQIIDDQLATISFSPTKILWNKPIIVGATILDLAKCFMFQFQEADLNLELLYNDTDSFIYAIKNDDVYRDSEKKKLNSTFQITMRTISCSSPLLGEQFQLQSEQSTIHGNNQLPIRMIGFHRHRVRRQLI